MNIVMLEDDPQQAGLVRIWLESCGHSVTHHILGADFIESCKNMPFDLAIMDWELPDQTGVEALKTLRQRDKQTLPVIFATQRDTEEDVISALMAGADDYMVKPLRQGELMARIEVLRRRAGIEAPSDTLTLGPIEINLLKRSVLVSGELVKITQKDFDVAVQLILNVGKVLSRQYLLKTIWGLEVEINTRTIDVHISRVRRSLKINPDMGYCITTIYQHGYRLEKMINTES